MLSGAPQRRSSRRVGAGWDSAVTVEAKTARHSSIRSVAASALNVQAIGIFTRLRLRGRQCCSPGPVEICGARGQAAAEPTAVSGLRRGLGDKYAKAELRRL